MSFKILSITEVSSLDVSLRSSMTTSPSVPKVSVSAYLFQIYNELVHIPRPIRTSVNVSKHYTIYKKLTPKLEHTRCS